VESFKTECSFGGVAGFGEFELFEEVFEDVDSREAGHFPPDEFSRKVAGVEAPIAVGEFLEEKFVER